MNKLTLPVILDSFFALLFSFIISMALMSLIGTQITVRLICSAFLALAIALLTLLLKQKKQNANLLTHTLEREKKNLLALIVNNKTAIIDLYKDFLVKNKTTYIEKNNYVEFNDFVISFALYPEELSLNELMRLIDFSPFKRLDCVVSASFSPSAVDNAKKLGLTLFGIDALFEFVKDNMPEILSVTECKRTLYDRISPYFSKRAAKKMIVYGVMLFSLSFLVFYPIYYIVSGSILVVYGVIALLITPGPSISKSSIDSFTTKNFTIKKEK